MIGPIPRAPPFLMAVAAAPGMRQLVERRWHSRSACPTRGVCSPFPVPPQSVFYASDLIPPHNCCTFLLLPLLFAALRLARAALPLCPPCSALLLKFEFIPCPCYHSLSSGFQSPLTHRICKMHAFNQLYDSQEGGIMKPAQLAI